MNSYEFRRLLERSPYSDREIGEAAGVSHSTVRRWRRAESHPSKGHVRDVADMHRDRVAELRGLLLELKDQVEWLDRTASGVDNGDGRAYARG